MGPQNWQQRKRAAATSEKARRSAFEKRIDAQLRMLGVEYTYEMKRVYFTPAPKKRSKLFDYWITTRSGKQIVVEAKGWWEPKARIAELEAIKQNPDLDVRYVFQNSQTKIRKGSPTSYADVCRRVGVLYADGAIPRSWLDE